MLTKFEKNNVVNPVEYSKDNFFDDSVVIKSAGFAYKMVYPNGQKHKNTRSGGKIQRSSSKMFANVCQGKMGEFAVYKKLKESGLNVSLPDLKVMDRREWDIGDLFVGDKKIGVKSVKYFSNVLFLEKKDWEEGPIYKYDDKVPYDYFILVRIAPILENRTKDLKINLKSKKPYKKLIDEVFKEEDGSETLWEYQIVGGVTKEMLNYAINNYYIITSGEKLNGNTTMDATNYYIQSCDHIFIEEIIQKIKNN